MFLVPDAETAALNGPDPRLLEPGGGPDVAEIAKTSTGGVCWYAPIYICRRSSVAAALQSRIARTCIRSASCCTKCYRETRRFPAPAGGLIAAHIVNPPSRCVKSRRQVSAEVGQLVHKMLIKNPRIVRR